MEMRDGDREGTFVWVHVCPLWWTRIFIYCMYISFIVNNVIQVRSFFWIYDLFRSILIRNFCRRKSNEILNSQEFILEWKNKLKEKESKARAKWNLFEKIWKNLKKYIRIVYPCFVCIEIFKYEKFEWSEVRNWKKKKKKNVRNLEAIFTAVKTTNEIRR